MARPPLPQQGDQPPWGDKLNTHVEALGTEIDDHEARVAALEDAPPGTGGGGVSDHGDLTGLSDDDHPQYLTQARGDARYAPVGSTGGGGGSTASTRMVPLFIFHGESNSGGMASNGLATPEELAPRPMLQILHSIQLDHFEDLDVGTNNNIDHVALSPNTHGWEIGLANSFEGGLWWNDVGYLVQTGQGASTVAQWAANGTYWQKFLERTRAARSLLRSQGLVPVIYVWQTLGLNDYNYGSGTPEATWFTEMQLLNERIRSELGPVPIISPLFMPSGEPYNDSLAALADQDKLMVLVESAGLPLKDAAHWEYDGMKTLAERMGAMSKDFGQHEAYLGRQNSVAFGYNWVPSGSASYPNIVRSPSSVTFTEGSAGSAFQVSLSGAPAATITVAVSVAGGNVQVDKSSLTFTTTNWGVAQSVTATSPNDNTVAGNRSSTVTLSSPGASGAVTVSVTVVDAGVVAGAPVNTALPAITGTAAVDSVLTCSQGTWSGSPTAYAYQWKRNGTTIAGATANTYTVVAVDQATSLACQVTATNASGSTAATAASVAVPAPPGTPMVDVVWKSLTNTAVDAYGYLVSSGSGGANFTSQVVTTGEFEVRAYWLSGDVVQEVVLALDNTDDTNHGWDASQTYVAGVSPYATTAYHSTSFSDFGVGNAIPNWAIQYPCYIRYKRSGSNPNDLLLESSQDSIVWTTRHTFVGVLAGRVTLYGKALVLSPVPGKKIKAQQNMPPVGAPVNTVPPAVTGVPEIGEVLTCSQGTWEGSPTSYTYQWVNGSGSISGATNNTYTVAEEDVAGTLTCAVTAINANGSSTAGSSGIFIPSPYLVTWSGFAGSSSPSPGKIVADTATLPVGALVATPIDATQPFEIEIELPGMNETGALICGLHDTNVQDYAWSATNIFLVTSYQWSGSHFTGTNSTQNIGTGLTISSWPTKIKMVKSGNDIAFYAAQGASGSYGAKFYTAAGCLAGKTNVYVKAVFSGASVGQNMTVSVKPG